MVDAHQPALWVDSFADALRDAVNAAGGPKRVAGELWPPKPVADAARLLNHCLDPDRAEKLALEEIVLICRLGKAAGCHTPMHHLAQELGYQMPMPIEPEDELARLQREFTEAVEAQRALVERMERLTECKTPNKPRDIASARWP